MRNFFSLLPSCLYHSMYTCDRLIVTPFLVFSGNTCMVLCWIKDGQLYQAVNPINRQLLLQVNERESLMIALKSDFRYERRKHKRKHTKLVSCENGQTFDPYACANVASGPFSQWHMAWGHFEMIGTSRLTAYSATLASIALVLALIQD